MDVTRPLKIIRFGAKRVTKHFKFIRLGEREGRMTGGLKGREGERQEPRTGGPKGREGGPEKPREEREREGERERAGERERERQTDLFCSRCCSRQ